MGDSSSKHDEPMDWLKKPGKVEICPVWIFHLSDGGIDQSLEQSSGFLSEFIAYHTT